MPIHDWTRVDAGIFHDFHQEWAAAIKHVLNGGVLPSGYYAMLEQTTTRSDQGKYIPDVLTLERRGHGNGAPAAPGPGGIAVLDHPPRTAVVAEGDLALYRRRKNVVAVRHVTDNRVVAVVEIVSPGNKSSAEAYRQFIAKVADLLDRGIHLLLVDIFPPTGQDPEGLHGAVWSAIERGGYRAPAEKPLTIASYRAGRPDAGIGAYAEPLAVGDRLPVMPLFVTSDRYVNVPLEDAYAAAWEHVPEWLREEIAAGS